MELVVKGRGVRIPDQLRQSAEQHLRKLERLEPRATRMEIEVSAERGREDGMKRLDGTLEVPRHVFRAHAVEHELGTALEVLLNRLERQVRDHRDKRRTRLHGRVDRLQSPTIGPEGAPR
jgi:ribosomal subunit interface protein